MEFWGFFHQFWRIFYIKNAYPPLYLPPDPPPLALQKGTHTLAGKILRPPTFFQLEHLCLQWLVSIYAPLRRRNMLHLHVFIFRCKRKRVAHLVPTLSGRPGLLLLGEILLPACLLSSRQVTSVFPPRSTLPRRPAPFVSIPPTAFSHSFFSTPLRILFAKCPKLTDALAASLLNPCHEPACPATQATPTLFQRGK